MSSARCKLSIVCPAFQEEEVLPKFHAQLAGFLTRLEKDYEIEVIYVDDGSRDNTLQVLQDLAAADPRVRFLSFSRNFGQQVAISAGLEHATGDVVITMDADLQHPPHVIPLMLERWKEGHDIVQTLRVNATHLGLVKRVTAWTFYRTMRMLSDLEMRPEVSDFRLMSRKVVDAFVRLRESHRFVRSMVNWLGFRSATVTFTTGHRAAGTSKYTLGKMVSLASDALLSFSRLPLRLALTAGAAASMLGLLVGACGLIRALSVAGPIDWGWYVLMTTVLLTGGCVLGALGIVGEYIGRIYEQVKGRPIYVLKDASPELMTEAEGRRPRQAA